MGNPVRQIQRRKTAMATLSQLMANPERVVVIHYSCESFYEIKDGSSPRITSIAVRNLATGQTISFSIHQIAERKKVSKDEIERYYDNLEKLMLDEFYGYVREHIHHHSWLHWNMRDINYGFPAIEHRYKVLGGEPVSIQESNLVDLARLLISIYGVGYIGHPRMENLIEKNNITRKDFLTGEEEAKAFTDKEYVKLHQSTLRKVDIFSNIVERVDNRTLKTNSKLKDLYGGYPEAIGELLKEHWLPIVITFVLTVIGTVLSIVALFK